MVNFQFAKTQGNTMKKYIDLSGAFDIRDQFCCLKMLSNMVKKGNLKSDTSSIYPNLSANEDLKLILSNIYYIPSSILEYTQSPVLQNLLIQVAEGRLTKENLASSKAIMSDEYANMLVEDSADPFQARKLVSLAIGKAAYRCACSDLFEICDFNNVEYREDSSLPSFAQSDSITLAMMKISNDTSLRMKVNNESSTSELSLLINSLDFGPDFEQINEENSIALSKLIINKDESGFVNLVGQAMNQATW
jgi:hypothetical protein